jgi:hypothetical protein
MDITKLTPEARVIFTRAGRNAATDDVLAQAARMEEGWRLYASQLALLGFTQEDMDASRGHVADQQARYAKRQETQVDKVASRQDARRAEKEAKQSRGELVQVGGAVLKAMEVVAQDDATQLALSKLRLATSAIVGSGLDVAALRDQVRALISALDQPELAAEVAKRAALPLADARPRLAALEAAITALEARRGAPELTEELDLVDGIILQYARDARRAARQAARRFGNPDIADAFALVNL